MFANEWTVKNSLQVRLNSFLLIQSRARLILGSFRNTAADGLVSVLAIDTNFLLHIRYDLSIYDPSSYGQGYQLSRESKWGRLMANS